MSKFRFSICALLLICGCAASEQKIGKWEGPSARHTSSASPWEYRGAKGRQITSDHYVIYTTIADDEFTSNLSELMEGAYEQYSKFLPPTRDFKKPMESYVFGSREQWMHFTREHTGRDANVYLQIERGGYAVGEKCVVYYLGPFATHSVLSHEGWHQYVAANFAGRMPPFIEEGIACMFEQIEWTPTDLPRWNLSVNRMRTHALRNAVDGKYLLSLNELISTHAGIVVKQNSNRIAAFYAQNWAFARFLWEGDEGKHREGFQRLLSDAAHGILRDEHGNAHQMSGYGWNPQLVKPNLEYYLGMKFDDIDAAYKAFMRKVAYEEFSAQWDS